MGVVSIYGFKKKQTELQMWIKSFLDFQCNLINQVVAFGAQLAIKYHEWQYHNGDIDKWDYLDFKWHIGYQMGLAHNLATVALFIIAALYGCFIMPHAAGWFAITVGNLRAKLGLQKRVWVEDEYGRSRPRAIPKEWMSFSTPTQASDAMAFENYNDLIAHGFTSEELPPQAGLLSGAFDAGVIFAKFSGAYFLFFAFYFLWYGDAQWLRSIHPW